MSLLFFKACRSVVRILGILTHPIYYVIALFSPRESIPNITNPILVTSVSVLAKKIRTGELTCHEVVSAFIDRCKQVNPIINAIVQDRFENALEDARKADDFLRTNEMSVSQLQNKKPLLGIPVTIKECCSVKGMKLSMGVKHYEKHKAIYNGEAVQRLINAGAIPIAITSTPPYSLWIETFNDIIGYTSNPHDTRKSVGGSSGGEAALIATAASVLGLGSDAGGSIRIPAAFCGIYGHKPTNGTVTSKGHVNFFSNQEALNMLTVGPLCRYAVDLELVMNVLTANKLKMSCFRSQAQLGQINIFYSYGFPQGVFSTNNVIKNRITEAVTHFKAEHNCQTKQVAIPEFENITEITWNHFSGLISSGIPSDHETLRKLWKIFYAISQSGVLNSDKNKQQKDLRTELLRLLEVNGVLLLPTWSESACYRYQSIWKLFNACYTYFINALGLPSTAVPIGLDRNKMPLSIQVISAPNQDHLCILVAKELEKLFGGWIPPFSL